MKAVESKYTKSFLTISSMSCIRATLWRHCLVVSAWDTNLAQIFNFFKLSRKIRCIMVLGTPALSSIIQHPTWDPPSQQLLLEPRAAFASVFVVAGLPLHSSFSNASLPKSMEQTNNKRRPHSRLTIDSFHHFKHFSHGKTEFSTKFYHDTLLKGFHYFKLWHEHSTYADNWLWYKARNRLAHRQVDACRRCHNAMRIAN